MAGQVPQHDPQTTPPAPAPVSMDDMRKKLTDLKKMFEDELLDEEEYKAAKTAILKEVTT
jgi:hypothetical protein